ncbi:hypothetical protein HDU99_004812, partial [Rhizoclosmatium hyalinum]
QGRSANSYRGGRGGGSGRGAFRGAHRGASGRPGVHSHGSNSSDKPDEPFSLTQLCLTRSIEDPWKVLVEKYEAFAANTANQSTLS